jgi:hypothetical protein
MFVSQIESMVETTETVVAVTGNQHSALYPEDVASSPVRARSQYKQDTKPRDRDSGVFLSDSEDLPSPRTPPLSLIASSVALKHTASLNLGQSTQRSDSTTRRLRRPAALNLGTSTTTTETKPKSELELRYDLIRNSQNKSKAALKSPTQLLQDRLNLSPKKGKYEEKIRIFTPPQPMLNGCILPGPAAQMQAFTGSSLRAKTEKTERPAWWCKVDKVVIFDGVEEGADGEMKLKTRTSKGLTIARRRGDTETIVIPMDCSHCQEMLNRHEWKYDVQVCKRVVCWDCRERCKWELEQEKVDVLEDAKDAEQASAEVNRMRADSVLQDDGRQAQDGDLRERSGIECEPKIPVSLVTHSV